MADDGTKITEQPSLPIELIKALESPLGSCTVCNNLIYPPFIKTPRLLVSLKSSHPPFIKTLVLRPLVLLRPPPCIRHPRVEVL